MKLVPLEEGHQNGHPQPKSWLQLYLEYTQESESPSLFHLWSGIAILGHVLGRKCYVERWRFRVYPGQILVVLVAESAISRKTAALTEAEKILSYLPEHYYNISPDLASTESFFSSLYRTHPITGEPLDSVGLILIDELGSWLSKSSYVETMVSHLNKLATIQKEEYRIEFRSWQATLRNPGVGMLATTTPEGFSEEMPRVAVKGGFMGRIIPVFAEGAGEPIPLVDPPAHFGSLERRLAVGLKRIAELSGEFPMDEEAKVWYKLWYREHFFWCQRTRIADSAALETGWQSRKHTHLDRVAMILAASGYRQIITKADYLAALTLLDNLQEGLPKVTQEIGTRQAYTAVTQRLIGYLEKAPLSWSDLLRKMSKYAQRDVLQAEINSLVEQGIVDREMRMSRAGNRIAWYSRVYSRGEMAYRAKPAEHQREAEDEETLTPPED